MEQKIGRYYQRFHNEGESGQEIITAGRINPIALERHVGNFRELVEVAWSSNTAYLEEARHNGSEKVGRFNPSGQCAVTSRLLVDVLKDQLPDVEVKTWQGRVLTTDGQVLNDNHVWVELKTDEQTIVIDPTPDQFSDSSSSQTKILVEPMENLSLHGYVYEREKEDTDDRMKQGGSYKRYEILKKRYEHVKKERVFYSELLDSNIYIVAPVAAGKNVLMDGLAERLPFNGIDMGKVFRMASLVILNDTDDNAANPNMELLDEGNIAEFDRVMGAISRRKKFLKEELLDKTTMVKDEKGRFNLQYQGTDLGEELDSDPVNQFVATVAKSPVVREAVWRWVKKAANDNGGTILTGHSLRDINTSAHKVLALDVEDDTAAERVSQRAEGRYTQDEALGALRRRNQQDHMAETQQVLSRIRTVDPIDTTSLTPDQVYIGALRRLVRQSKDVVARNQYQEREQVERTDFTWDINPLIANIRTAGSEIISSTASTVQTVGVTEFDLAVQTMIHVAGYEPEEVWRGNNQLLQAVRTKIQAGETSGINQMFEDALNSGNIQLNTQLVERECARQAERLAHHAEHMVVVIDGQEVKLPAAYMSNPELSPFAETGRSEINAKQKTFALDIATGKTNLVVKEKHSGREITFRSVPGEISTLYGKGFHYLHEGRSDEIAGFGAFLEDDALPFAWVSYSPVDRDYKQEMLEHLGMEPHTIVELTRAWNASWSPKNTMSTLFGYAHQSLQREWESKVDLGEVDKPLSGVVSAINPNLGFNGSAFSAANFRVVGLKPANFTYMTHPDGTFDYMPRRSIVQSLGLNTTAELEGHPQYRTSMVPLIPTNEMAVIFDKAKQEEIMKRPLYRIPDSDYKTA